MCLFCFYFFFYPIVLLAFLVYFIHSLHCYLLLFSYPLPFLSILFCCIFPIFFFMPLKKLFQYCLFCDKSPYLIIITSSVNNDIRSLMDIHRIHRLLLFLYYSCFHSVNSSSPEVWMSFHFLLFSVIAFFSISMS